MRDEFPKYNPLLARIRNIIIVIIILTPLWSFIYWKLKEKKILNIVIIDKTVPTANRNEHRSFNWILTNSKYVKPDKSFYSINKDYYGFFPLKPLKEKKFEIKDLEQFSEAQLDSISNISDMVYFTDTYGVYHNEWYEHKNMTEHSPFIYGGLSNNDYNLIEKMKERKKLIIAEFNFFHSPTPDIIRIKTERLLDLIWTNWTGRYFESLDSNRINNPELPQWVVKDYLRQHHGIWNFRKSGIVLHNEDGRIEILENETDLNIETPYIIPTAYAKQKYHLPDSIHFSYWFDITYPGAENRNKVIAYYKIFTNKKGDSILNKLHLSNIFPGIIEHVQANDYTFYYFAGDMADNPIENLSSYFGGVQYLSFMLYSNEPSKRKKFFYKFYYPLVNPILQDCYKNKVKGK
jgi:hypothetical protein